MDPVALPPVQPPESSTPNTPLPTAPLPSANPIVTPSNDGSISLVGVDASYKVYLMKHWYFIVLGILILLGIGYENPIYSIILFFLGLGIGKKYFENNLFKSFAAANSFDYQKKGSPSYQSGLIFSIGHGQTFSDIVSGIYKIWPFSLYMFGYTIGYGRDSHHYDRAVMSINFDTPLAAFVLRRHKLFQILEEEGESLKSNGYSEKVNLEGDFNDHFQVYIRPNTQVDVLTILTPDLMQELIGLDRYELEMTDEGNLYVYCHGLITETQKLVDLYKIVEMVSQKIGRDAERQQIITQAETEATAEPTLHSPTA